MNYSNMIEEKHLKKGFIIATLCSTIIGTFTTSIGLYDRLADRRKQKKRDIGQDEEIQKLKKQVEQSSRAADDNNRRAIEYSRGGRGPPLFRDEVGDSLERSGALIRREYDEGYSRLGSRFAIGDTITENRLQAQIISLQQTVIKVLQDAVYDGRDLTRSDMAKLMSASQIAREGSLDALRQQRERLQIEAGPPPPLPLPNSKEQLIAAAAIEEEDPLFCPYSLTLQSDPSKPMSYSFAPGQDCRCPSCGLTLDVESEDFWEIAKKVPVVLQDPKTGFTREVLEEVEFQIGQRFVVKCHKKGEGKGKGVEYACVLCAKHRDKDCICPSVEALINHVGRFHDVGEMEREVDIEELGSSSAPPPPPPKGMIEGGGGLARSKSKSKGPPSAAGTSPGSSASKSSAGGGGRRRRISKRSSPSSSSPSLSSASIQTSHSSLPPEAPSPPMAQMMDDLDLRDRRRVDLPSKYR